MDYACARVCAFLRCALISYETWETPLWTGRGSQEVPPACALLSRVRGGPSRARLLRPPWTPADGELEPAPGVGVGRFLCIWCSVSGAVACSVLDSSVVITDGRFKRIIAFPFRFDQFSFGKWNRIGRSGSRSPAESSWSIVDCRLSVRSAQAPRGCLSTET